MASKRLDLTPQEELARRTLDLFKRLRGLSDAAIGAHLGVQYQAIEQRRKGHTRIHPHRDVPKLAEALRIDEACFYMSDGELLRWIENEAPDLLLPATGWLHRFLAVA